MREAWVIQKAWGHEPIKVFRCKTATLEWLKLHTAAMRQPLLIYKLPEGDVYVPGELL